MTIRGVGNFNALYGYEPGVGVYIDDVYYPTLYGSQIDLLDLDRVEVLRGPQGTLAGKNSIGGAVKLYSQQPQGGNDGYLGSHTRPAKPARLARGGRSSRWFPISCSYASRASRNRSTDMSTASTTSASTLPPTCRRLLRSTRAARPDARSARKVASTTTALRGSIRYIGLDHKLDTTLQFDVYSDNDDAQPDRLIIVNQASPNAALLNPFLNSGKYESYSTFQTQTGRGFSGVNKLQGWGASDKISYEFAGQPEYHFHQRLSRIHRRLPGRSRRIAVWHDDRRSAPAVPVVHAGAEAGGSILDNMIEYTLGGYYYNATGHQAGLLQISGVAVPPPAVPTVFALNSLQGDIIESQSRAAFLNTIIHPFAKFDITAGVRWTHDEKSYDYHRRDAQTLVAISPPDGLGGEFSGDRTDYRVALAYHWTDQIMTYGSGRDGVQGRRRQSGHLSRGTDRAVRAREAHGLRDRLEDVALRPAPHAGSFRVLQQVQGHPADHHVGHRHIRSAGVGSCEWRAAATIKGVELEANASFGRFKADASVSVLDFEYDNIRPGTGIQPSFITPYTPKTKWSAGVQYKFPIVGDEVTLTPRFDVSHQSEIYSLAINAPTNQSSAFTVANAHLVLQNESKNWSFDLAATNLFDKYYYTSIYANLYGLMGTISGGRSRSHARSAEPCATGSEGVTC